ncbi:helix-turn-helix domain-containing protein [Halomicroarcula sp. F13]|uniref:Helix-turn-helix domain-containing protein n=1 Tax=Haloarcula rubra TaxID=2487747 RepID=A0AAW4PSB4_9EURY|nr:helix-turn-helix domain-containing protein [Halomicroarcula rubra]MBX0324161.1 helix-turn-helix domain-containing protein [Halomicroarcula rubra]
MSLIAVIRIDHEKLTLAPTVERVPSVDVRVVTNSMTDPETSMFFFLVQSESGEFERFDAAVERDDTVAEAMVVSESDTSRLYRFTHRSDTELLSPKVTELGGLVLEARTADTGWRLRLQLPDRQAIAELWEHCRSEGIAFDLVRVYDRHGMADGTVTAVSEEQRRALTEAYRCGYFAEPRETTQAELAERLGICPTAVGGRLRRGTRQLVEDVLVDE